MSVEGVRMRAVLRDGQTQSLIDLELVHEFQTMGTHFNTIYLHLKEKTSLNDPNEWASALIRVYTMEKSLYERMKMSFLSDSKWIYLKLYLNALEAALLSFQNGMNGCKEDPRICIHKGTVLYRFAWLSDDSIRRFKNETGREISLKSFI